jgi:two-component system, sporulation sensor kinase A
MTDSFSRLFEDIAVSLDGMPGPALGCFMVDRQLRLLWHKHFKLEMPGADRSIIHCYEMFKRREPCDNCAAFRAFSTGKPASCEQVVTDSDGKANYYHLVGSPIKDNHGQVVRYVEVLQDISARSEAEERYRKISEFNYNIIYNAPIAIFTLNQHGVITSTNPAHIKLAGNPPLNELLGFDWLNSANVIECGLDEYLKMGLSGKSFMVADFPYTSNLTGRSLFMTFRGVPLKNKKGDIDGLLCIVADTTEKTKYLKEVEQLKKYNENIIQSIADGIMVIDRDLRILTWNNGMAEIFGIDRGQALEMPLNKCLKKIGVSESVQSIRNLISAGVTRQVEKASVYHPEKGTISVNYKLMPLFDENQRQSGIILFFENITQKEQLEIKYQSLFKGAKDGILVSDTLGRLISANPRILKLLETNWSALRNKKLEKLLDKIEREKFKKSLAEIKKGNEVTPLEVKLTNNGQEPIPVEMSISKVMENDKAVAFQFIIRDIRERVKLEKQLLQAGKLSGLGELAAGVAHEINNPLAAISGCSEEVLDLLAEWNSESGLSHEQISELKDLVTMLKVQSYRCKDITQNLLNFARVNEPTLVDVNLNSIIRSILSFAGYQKGRGMDRVQLNLDAHLPAIKSDYSQIQQVFLNILKNALDATEAGGTVFIDTFFSEPHAVVSFRDTGVGIALENIERIFNPFFTTKSPNRGTGLGLSISYRILEQLGGTIDVQSLKGVGTTFNIMFPVSQNDRIQ